jgi:hypothetical protein
MARYKADPRWITTKFATNCARRECKRPIKKGENVFYYPSSKDCYCDNEDCGKQSSREFDASTMDEAIYTGQSF